MKNIKRRGKGKALLSAFLSLTLIGAILISVPIDIFAKAPVTPTYDFKPQENYFLVIQNGSLVNTSTDNCLYSKLNNNAPVLFNIEGKKMKFTNDEYFKDSAKIQPYAFDEYTANSFTTSPVKPDSTFSISLCGEQPSGLDEPCAVDVNADAKTFTYQTKKTNRNCIHIYPLDSEGNRLKEVEDFSIVGCDSNDAFYLKLNNSVEPDKDYVLVIDAGFGRCQEKKKSSSWRISFSGSAKELVIPFKTAKARTDVTTASGVQYNTVDNELNFTGLAADSNLEFSADNGATWNKITSNWRGSATGSVSGTITYGTEIQVRYPATDINSAGEATKIAFTYAVGSTSENLEVNKKIAFGANAVIVETSSLATGENTVKVYDASNVAKFYDEIDTGMDSDVEGYLPKLTSAYGFEFNLADKDNSEIKITIPYQLKKADVDLQNDGNEFSDDKVSIYMLAEGQSEQTIKLSKYNNGTATWSYVPTEIDAENHTATITLKASDFAEKKLVKKGIEYTSGKIILSARYDVNSQNFFDIYNISSSSNSITTSITAYDYSNIKEITLCRAEIGDEKNYKEIVLTPNSANWKVNKPSASQITYTDTDVETGKDYLYWVDHCVDNLGNVSTWTNGGAGVCVAWCDSPIDNLNRMKSKIISQITNTDPSVVYFDLLDRSKSFRTQIDNGAVFNAIDFRFNEGNSAKNLTSGFECTGSTNNIKAKIENITSSNPKVLTMEDAFSDPTLFGGAGKVTRPKNDTNVDVTFVISTTKFAEKFNPDDAYGKELYGQLEFTVTMTAPGTVGKPVTTEKIADATPLASATTTEAAKDKTEAKTSETVANTNDANNIIAVALVTATSLAGTAVVMKKRKDSEA